MALRGTFDYSLDAKNRLTVPAKFRGSLGERVVLAKGTAKCVTVWTPDEFDAYVAAALAGEHPLSPRADQINRYFQANSVELEIDSAGRVGIPPFLMDHAGLAKEVVVTGVGSRLEVWDRQAWADYNANLDIAELTASFGNAA
jgi:MraZ protein